MKQLHVPVPASLTASYLVPLSTAMTGAEVRQRAIGAVDARVSGPIRLLILQWILNDAMTIQVTASPDRMVPMPRQPDSLTPEQLARLTGARAFAQVTATSAASLIAVREWKALGPAAALAASLGVPVVDAQAMKVLSAPDALTALPDTNFSGTPGDDIRVGLSLQPWVSFHGLAREGTYWAVSEGMRRFGLPEFRVGGCERDLRAELAEILSGVTFRIWSDLITAAQTTPRATPPGPGHGTARAWQTGTRGVPPGQAVIFRRRTSLPREPRLSLADDAARHLVNWYCRAGESWLGKRIASWAQRMEVEVADLRVLPLGYRWGSCTAVGRLNIHWATMQLPPDLIDYVLVHELAHVRHADHGPDFWRAVEPASGTKPTWPWRIWLQHTSREPARPKRSRSGRRPARDLADRALRSQVRRHLTAEHERWQAHQDSTTQRAEDRE
jgi:hypothetical protein